MLTGWIIALVLSLVALVFCADRFTHASTQLARLLRLPEFIVGVTVVSIGTSLPELITSIVGVSTGRAGGAELVLGTVIGSNVANILLIAGLTAVVVKKIALEHRIIELETVLLAISGGFLVLTAMDGEVTRSEGLFMVVAYIILAVFAVKQYKTERVDRIRHFPATQNTAMILLNIGVFGVGLAGAAWGVVRSTLSLAELTGLSTSALAVTAVALGTSLPELIVTLRAAYNKHADLAIGNIIGSNVFNVLAIVGIPAMIHNLPVSSDMIFIGLPFFVAATVLYIFTGMSKKLNAYEGAIFLLLYGVFLGKIFHWF
ncbi:MAG: calcium/sodium antiporter [Patescibacteria group bacterium]